MCKICGRYVCPPVCPENIGRLVGKGYPCGACGTCGRLIYATDNYTRVSQKLLCSDCLAASTPSEAQLFDIWSR